MLHWFDEPTIRNAILKRLDCERGIQVCEVKAVPHLREAPPFIAVGVLALVDDLLIARSHFHLPAEWTLAHLRNEIDEIAEQYKAMRKLQFGRGGLPMPAPEAQIIGTGLRGRWRLHA